MEWAQKGEIEMWRNYGEPPPQSWHRRPVASHRLPCGDPMSANLYYKGGDFVKKDHDVNKFNTVIEDTISISTVRHISKRLFDRLHKYMRRGNANGFTLDK